MIFIYLSEDQTLLDFCSFELIKKIKKFDYITLNKDLSIEPLITSSLFNEPTSFFIRDSSFLQKIKKNDFMSLINSNNDIYCFLLIKPTQKINPVIDKQYVKYLDKWTNKTKSIFINNWIKQNNINFSNEQLSQVMKILPNNPFIVFYFLFKLKTIISNNVVTTNDIKDCIDFDREQVIFDLMSPIIEHKYDQALSIFEQLIDSGAYIPMEIIDIISKQLFYVKLIAIGNNQSLSDIQIEKDLQFNHFRYMMAENLSAKTTIKHIDYLLDQFHQIEIDAKINLSNPYFSLKLLLLNNDEHY